MPSPFPGMDPYLERPGRWADFHNRFINAASDLLVTQLLPRYIVRIEERVYLDGGSDEPRGSIVPDLLVLHPGDAIARPAPVPAAVAQPHADTVAAVEELTQLEDEVREPRLEVVDPATGRVVTVLEFLSPTNKTPDSAGWRSYREKRAEVMHSPSHFVEIDLLRAGRRFVTPRRLTRFDYLVHVSRESHRPRGLLWGVLLEQRLPPIPIPLNPGDEDATLDLQAALDTSYDRAGYQYQLDYRSDPPVPLTPQQSEWADRLLREKGLR